MQTILKQPKKDSAWWLLWGIPAWIACELFAAAWVLFLLALRVSFYVGVIALLYWLYWCCR